jgi:UDP-glucose 4,6-dehydratase
MRYDTLLEATNSISHLEEFVNACWQTWDLRAPFGIYNITNTGSVTTSEVVDLIRQELRLEKTFKFFDDEKQFMELAAKTPRSNCVLDNSKLLATGIKMRDVRDAIAISLKNWRPQV